MRASFADSMEERRELLVEAVAKVQYPVLPSVAFDAKPAELVPRSQGAWAGGHHRPGS